MQKPMVTGIIPARYGSSRLPGKPLALIAGKPMIWHVYEQCRRTALLQDLWVATDDERIQEAVVAFGGQAMMTRIDHSCGTDRIAEAAEKLETDIVVNIQGDQPFIDPAMIDQTVQPLLDCPQAQVATLMKPVLSEEELNDPGVVKAVTDLNGRALYFSRSLIPYPRENTGQPVYEHIGLYAYRKDVLLELTALEETALEKTELLEQLRWLEHGYHIQVDIVTEGDHAFHGFSVDTEEDLLRAKKLYEGRTKADG